MEGLPRAVIIQKLGKDGTSERLQKILHTDREGMYLLGPELGEGGISRVVSARHLGNGEAVAIKMIERGFQANSDMSNEFRAMQEIKCLSCLTHRNVVGYKSSHSTDDSIYIIQELVNGISLLDYLKHKGNRLKTGAALHIFYQAVKAVEYCHSCGVFHRDIKLENMIVDINGVVQLIDFDLAHRAHVDEGSRKLDVFCGTPHIACPEIWNAEPYDGEKADIWSLGVILYVLLNGAYPFDGETLEELREEILYGALTIPLDLPTPMKELITRMLLRDPAKRISTKELVKHPVVAAAGVTNACIRSKLSGTRANSGGAPTNSAGGKEVAHPWQAPVVDNKRAANVAKGLSKELLKLPDAAFREPNTNSQPSTPMWETHRGGWSPMSSSSGGATMMMGSPCPCPSSPSRKEIFQALDDLLDEPTEGLSAEDRNALLVASSKDAKISNIDSILRKRARVERNELKDEAGVHSSSSSNSSPRTESHSSSSSVSSHTSSSKPSKEVEDTKLTGLDHLIDEYDQKVVTSSSGVHEVRHSKAEVSTKYAGRKRKVESMDHEERAKNSAVTAEIVKYVICTPNGTR
eukprot:CAMPEP_0114501246 /NCGR_PEP_ID=MMETSP0109-20121206/8395_1 /TAXON_ID=29199 /ORGANISM="Chlorarachnion reptans, Strain CCCM449" /LENGTH=577 /DNA_ID=CAMNT_0001678961 /DNA_START=145 /DNA_END=1878 /DNA_ORIENTATION=+